MFRPSPLYYQISSIGFYIINSGWMGSTLSTVGEWNKQDRFKNEHALHLPPFLSLFFIQKFTFQKYCNALSMTWVIYVPLQDKPETATSVKPKSCFRSFGTAATHSAFFTLITNLKNVESLRLLNLSVVQVYRLTPRT